MDSARKPLVLVVDDTEDNRILFTTVLEHAGYRTAIAKDGFEALTQAREHRPALVILDSRMPGLYGGEVARQLAADPETSDIRLIAVTADLAYTADDARGDGFCAYLTQPLLPDHLRRSVDFCLGMDRVSGPRWIDLPLMEDERREG